MHNGDPSVARSFHERTKHSYESVRRAAAPLDWANRPHPFKEYRGLELLPLEPPAPPTEVPALAALAGLPGPARAVSAAELARLLRYGAGVTKTRRYGPETYHFRAYSSAGALYPIEVYLARADGLFHFHPLERALRRLRGEDVRAVLAEAADTPGLAEAEAVLLLSGVLWRTAWKYRERGYRHLYWDAGTMLANLLALASSAGHEPRLFTGFVDASVNQVLGADGRREAALALLAVGRGRAAAAAQLLLPRLELEAAPLSKAEVSYAEAWTLHEASSLGDPADVRRYRAGSAPPPPGASQVADSDPLETAIERRISAREFAPEPIPIETLAGLLAVTAAPIPADVRPCNDIYTIANAVDGLASGTYRFRPPGGFELLRSGSFRTQASYLVLEQSLGARSAATVFYAADLDRVLSRLGNRGYRWAQLEAGIRAGRAQVGAYALGLAAVASTFYDDEVADFLTEGRSPLLCVAVGYRPARRR